MLYLAQEVSDHSFECTSSYIIIKIATPDIDDSTSECECEQEMAAVKQELAAVKAEVNQLHSQLHYWQNVTVNILKDHYSSLNTGS